MYVYVCVCVCACVCVCVCVCSVLYLTLSRKLGTIWRNFIGLVPSIILEQSCPWNLQENVPGQFDYWQ